ncbi:MAG TPA: hypothetical protein VJ371_05865, partial [Streptosporangiaceae bacterium]|nr:hypothetical protein [Streptosporangiaceae bacterium]
GVGAVEQGLAAQPGGVIPAARMSGSADPQARQKRSPEVTGSPHDGQPPEGAPHPPQNRSPSARDAPHCPHLT